MAWCPFATRMELLPEAREQSVIRPTQVIFHSIVAPWTPRRTYEYWRDSTNLESHFGVGYGGDVAQYLSSQTRADANYRANRRPDGTGAISVETTSNTTATDEWTAAQVETLIRLGVWAHQRHGIPLRICRTHSDPGFGYHKLHSAWSPSGTACPGRARTRQFHDVVFPGIVARATGNTREDDVPIRTSLGKDRDQDAPWGEWTQVKWDREYADPEGAHANGNYPGYVAQMSTWADFHGRVVVDGMKPGDQLQVRYEVHDWKNGESAGAWTEVIDDRGATPGKQFIPLGWSKGLREGQHVYVAVCPYSGEGREDAPAPRLVDGRWCIAQDTR